MSAIEYERQLTEARNQETSKKEIIASLIRAKDDVIAQGKGTEAVLANEKLVAAQKQLVDSAIIVKACESKLNYYKKNEPDALKISHVLADELYPQGVKHYEKLRVLLSELKPTVEKIAQINEEMVSHANHYRQLIGDKLLNPQITLPPEIYSIVNVKLGPAPPKLDVRTASQREQQHLKDQFEEQRPLVSKILKHVNIEYPLCPLCGIELLATRYHLANDESHGHVSLRCSQHPSKWLDVSFPALAPPPGARWPISDKDPLPPGDIRGSVSAIQSHGLNPSGRAGLTGETKGGKKAK
jgi:hypothetical protein